MKFINFHVKHESLLSEKALTDAIKNPLEPDKKLYEDTTYKLEFASNDFDDVHAFATLEACLNAELVSQVSKIKANLMARKAIRQIAQAIELELFQKYGIDPKG